MYDPARDTFTSATAAESSHDEPTPKGTSKEETPGEACSKTITPSETSSRGPHLLEDPSVREPESNTSESPRKVRPQDGETASQDATPNHPVSNSAPSGQALAPPRRSRPDSANLSRGLDSENQKCDARPPDRSPKQAPSPNQSLGKRPLSSSRSPNKRVKLASPSHSPRPPRHGSLQHYRRRSPPPKEPLPPPPKSPNAPPRSPPRERKRPGASARIAASEKELLRKRQLERTATQLSTAQAIAQTRGVHDVVKNHYNNVTQYGRDFRQKESRIRGLRNYNNWVKSTLIQKFSPTEDFLAKKEERGQSRGLQVLDVGCGKGGDLGKWDKAPQRVETYVGIDPAEVSIEQARGRYAEMRSRWGRGGRGFFADFFAKDGYGEWIGDIPLVREIGIDGSVGPGGGGNSRWGGGGFDVVTMMFCMHYAFESEAKARGMLKNVAGALKKGGRFIGVIPNSDVLRNKVEEFNKGRAAKDNAEKEGGEKGVEEGEVEDLAVPEWGNSIYRVRFPGKTPEDGAFRPPYGWKYSYFMEEAVEEVPEYVVPWEAFRALAEDYNLEMQYRKPFADIWKEEKDDPILGPLSVRMGVREGNAGPLKLTEEELEAVSFYHAFCFYKV